MDLYERDPRVLWRRGPDRVLVRRVGGESHDVMGPAALVWVALDERRSIRSLEAELSGLGIERPRLVEALEMLLRDRLALVSTSP